MKHIQKSFARGILSPNCLTRTNIPGYDEAARELFNVHIGQQGEAYKRGGLAIMARLQQAPVRVIPFKTSEGPYLIAFTGNRITDNSSSDLVDSDSVKIFPAKDWEINAKDMNFSSNDFYPSEAIKVYGRGTEDNIDIWEPYWQDVRHGLTASELRSMDYAQLGNVIVFCGESFPPFTIRKEDDEFVYYRNLMDMLVNGDQSENKQKSLEKAIKTLPFNFYGYGINIYRSHFFENSNYEAFVGNLTLKENYDQGGLSERNLRHWTNRAFVVSTFEESEIEEENAGIRIYGGIIKKLRLTSRSDPTQYEISGFVKSLDGTSDVENQWSEDKNPNLHLCDWSEKLGWPSSVTVFENRFIFGGNSAFPSKIWYSAQPSVQKVQKGTKETISYATAGGVDRVQSRTVQPISQTLYFEQSDFFSIDLSATGLLPLQSAAPGNLFINDNLGFKILWVSGGEFLFIGTDIGIFTSRGTLVDSANPVPFNSGFQRPVEIPVKRVFPIVIDETLYYISQDNSVQLLDPRGERSGFVTQTLDNFSREVIRDVWIRSRITKFLPTQNILANPSYNPDLAVTTTELTKSGSVLVQPYTKMAGSKTTGIIFTEAEGGETSLNIPASGEEILSAPDINYEYGGSRVRTDHLTGGIGILRSDGYWEFPVDGRGIFDTSGGDLRDDELEFSRRFHIHPTTGLLIRMHFAWSRNHDEFDEIWSRNIVYMLGSSSLENFMAGNFIVWRLDGSSGDNNEVPDTLPLSRFGTYADNLDVEHLRYFRTTLTLPTVSGGGSSTSGFARYQVGGSQVTFTDLTKTGPDAEFNSTVKMVGDETSGVIVSKVSSELKFYKYEVSVNAVTVTELMKTGAIPALENYGIAGGDTNGVIFGGEVSGSTKDVFYKYEVSGSGVTITELAKTGEISALKEMGIVGTGTTGIIFGGLDSSGNRQAVFYKYEVSADAVTITTLVTMGTIPTLRDMGIDGDVSEGIIFGGRANNIQFNYYKYEVSGDNVTVTQLDNTNNATPRAGMQFIGDDTSGIIFAGSPDSVKSRFDQYSVIAQNQNAVSVLLENETDESNIYPVFNSNTRLLFDWSRRILFLIREGNPYLAFAKNKETGVAGWSRGEMNIQDAVFLNGLPFRPPEIFPTIFGIRGNNIVMLSQGLHSYKENFLNDLPNGIDNFIALNKTTNSIDLSALKVSLKAMGYVDDDFVVVATDIGVIKQKSLVSDLSGVLDGIDGQGFIVGTPYGFHLKTWQPLMGRLLGEQFNITQIVYNAIKNSEFLLNDNYVYENVNPHSNAEIHGNQFLKQVSQSKLDFDPTLEIKGDSPFPFAISGYVIFIPKGR